jgi:nucleoside 2-deoxyribosyltransferase
MSVSFYLCGPILEGDERWRSIGWREVAYNILTEKGFTVFNPMVSAKAGDVHYDETFKELIVPRDKLMIDRSDIIIVNYVPKELSIGTCMEIMYAHMTGKKVIWFAEDQELCLDLEDNPWVIAHNDWEFVRPFSAEVMDDIAEWFNCFKPHNPLTISRDGWQVL